MKQLIGRKIGRGTPVRGNGWKTIPRHPTVDRQGRMGIIRPAIDYLHPYGERILVGYGDYGWNSGPVDVWSFDRDGDWKLHARAVDSEAVATIVDLSGEPVALHTDPLGFYTWNGLTPLTRLVDGVRAGKTRTIHSFDACTLPDGGWWVVGSIWETDASKTDVAGGIISYDRGETWEHYPYPRTTDNPNVYDRFYRAGVYEGMPYAWGGLTGHAVLRDGVWEKIPDDVAPEAAKRSAMRYAGEIPNISGDGFASSSLEHNGRIYVGMSNGDIIYRELG